MDKTAFELREEHRGTVTVGEGDQAKEIPRFLGGVLAVPPEGRNFDVARKLKDGDGVIVVSTSNEPLVELLRSYPPLQECDVPEGRGKEALIDQTIPQLQDQLRALGLPVSGTKDQLVERLQEGLDSTAEGGD